jgi:hypothetical protein
MAIFFPLANITLKTLKDSPMRGVLIVGVSLLLFVLEVC